MSVEDAAAALGCSERRVRQLVHTPDLEAGSIRGTVTVKSVAARQRLIKRGLVKRGPKPKTKKGKL